MNKEKLSKIFEIYRELNRPNEIEIRISLDTQNDRKLAISKKIFVLLTPSSFVIKGDFSNLSKENLIKVLDETKTFIDKEYENLKIKINSLREKL